MVNQTVKSVVESACSYDPNRSEIIENTSQDDLLLDNKFYIDSADEMETEEDDDVLDLGVIDLARAHWIQLHKLNKQIGVVQHALLYILERYKHVRPIWSFGIRIDDTDKKWKKTLLNDFCFKQHCASIQAAITMLLENVDDREYMRKLLNEIGAHHFFYDTCEPHLELIEQTFLESLRNPHVSGEPMDIATEQSWELFLHDVKIFMGEGIAIQRNTYLRECMTSAEIADIRSKWEKIAKFGLQNAGEIVCETAIKTYSTLVATHNLKMIVPLKRSSSVFSQVAEMTMKALETTINSHSEIVGFCDLAASVKEFVVSCMVLEICPTFARKAIIDGLFAMLSKVFGEQEMSESLSRTWNKVYRALEQAVIINIVEY